MGGVKTGIRNYKQTVRELQALKGKSEKVIQRVMSDMRTRAPGWIASEVVKEYGIKKAEITPAKAGKAAKAAGSIKVKGETVETMQIVYRGRLLTPIHFHMTPTTPPAGKGYTLKAEILKGNKAVLGKKKKLTKKQRTNIGRNFHRKGTQNSPQSPWMLQHTGAKSKDKVQYIPFQRREQTGKMMYAFRTVSLPQMVSSERTREGIDKALEEGLEKRMAQHMKLLEK